MTSEDFAVAYEKNFSRTVRYLRQWALLSHNDAEDIAQGAWVRGFEKLSQLKGNIANWVISIARNIYLTQLRAHHQTEALKDIFQDRHSGKMDDQLIEQQLVSNVNSSINSLPKIYRTVLLQQCEGMSSQEIALVTKAKKSYVRVKLCRAKRMFKARYLRRTKVAA